MHLRRKRTIQSSGLLRRRMQKESVSIAIHCQPCPAGLDVGLINKYYDLAQAGDVLAKDHYMNLEKTASDCIACGHCDSRCPFHVEQVKRMEEIRGYFGK